MRALAIALITAALLATPAAAQLVPGQTSLQLQQMELQMQQDMARQRDVALQNELMSLEARLQADRSIATLRAQQERPYLPLPPRDLTGPPAMIDTSKLVEIPNDRLAASNRAVEAASRPARR